MSKSKYDIPRHILLNYEQDQWAEQEADRLGLSTGAYFRTLLDDDKARKESNNSCNKLSPYHRAERRREYVQNHVQNNEANVDLALTILKLIKSAKNE